MIGGGRPLVPEILGQADHVRAKTPISNWHSLVASRNTCNSAAVSPDLRLL